MTQEEARLRCVALVMAGGQYDGDRESLLAHFMAHHSGGEDVAVLRARCGAKEHWGGNTCGERVTPELLALAWPGATPFSMGHDCSPAGCMFFPIHHKGTPERYSWSQIANEIRAMLGTERAKMKSANADAFAKNGKEPEKMTGLTTNESTQELRRIEMRIATHYQHAADELIGVGLCLIEAKEKKLVPHGQWEGWLREHTGMSERNAQRLMAVAREVPRDSVLSTLPMSQVTAILALPEPEREDAAKEAAAADLSTRQLQEAIKAKQAAEEALEALKGEIPVLAEKQAAEVISRAVTQTKAQAEEAMKRAQAEAQEKIAHYKAETDKAAGLAGQKVDEILALKKRLTELQGSVATADEAEKLRAALADAEERLREQMKKRQAAQNDLLTLKKQMARGDVPGDTTDGLTLDGMAEAARSFLGKVGTLPHMAGKLAGISDESRATWEQYVDMVSAWAEGAHRALQTVGGVVRVD